MRLYVKESNMFIIAVVGSGVVREIWCWECLFKEKNIDDIDEGEVSIANGP